VSQIGRKRYKRSMELGQKKKDAIELAFLRFFYEKAESVFGPASDDVIESIKEDYHDDLPEGY
jgi:hypothetical protein